MLSQPDRNCHEMSRVVEGTMNKQRIAVMHSTEETPLDIAHTQIMESGCRTRTYILCLPISLCITTEPRKEEVFSSTKKHLHHSL